MGASKGALVYSVAIVDDNLAQAQELARMVEASAFGAELSVTYWTAAEGLEERVRGGHAPDILFMDVCLHDAEQLVRRADAATDVASDGMAPEGPSAAAGSAASAWAPRVAAFEPAQAGASRTGIDVVADLLAAGLNAQVVYLSGYDVYHTRIYRTPHACYLQKPFRQADVDEALAQAVAGLRQAGGHPVRFHLKGEERVVSPRDIIYIESNRRRVQVHLRRESFETYARLADLERELPPSFVRCHQSFLVNLDYVSSLGTSAIELVGGDTVPVSRRYRPGVREALFAHIRSGQ